MLPRPSGLVRTWNHKEKGKILYALYLYDCRRWCHRRGGTLDIRRVTDNRGCFFCRTAREWRDESRMHERKVQQYCGGSASDSLRLSWRTRAAVRIRRTPLRDADLVQRVCAISQERAPGNDHIHSTQ